MLVLYFEFFGILFIHDYSVLLLVVTPIKHEQIRRVTPRRGQMMFDIWFYSLRYKIDVSCKLND